MINKCLADSTAAQKEIDDKGFIMVSIPDPDDPKGPKIEQKVEEIGIWKELTEWDKFVLIPVLVTKDSSSSNNYYGNGSSQIISIQHDLKPSYARLKGGTNPANVLQLEVVSTSFKKPQSQSK